MDKETYTDELTRACIENQALNTRVRELEAAAADMVAQYMEERRLRRMAEARVCELEKELAGEIHACAEAQMELERTLSGAKREGETCVS